MIVATTHIANSADVLVQARHLMAEIERLKRERVTQVALQTEEARRVHELRERVRAESVEAMLMLLAAGLPCPRSDI